VTRGQAQGHGIPPNFQSLVEHAKQTGGASSGGTASNAEHSKNAAVAHIATKVVNAAYNAFGSGLHEALVLSGCLILAGAVVAALTIPPRGGGEVRDLVRSVAHAGASRRAAGVWRAVPGADRGARSDELATLSISSSVSTET
jgi:hypothetical protein